MKGRPGLALAAALLTLAPLSAACGAGLDAETLREGTTIDGANAQTGDLRIRNAFLAAPQEGIEFPAGSDISIHVTVANIGNQADTLTEATSPLGQVVVQSQPASPGLPSTAPSGPSGPPTGGSADAQSSTPVAIPAGQSVTFGETGAQLTLRQVSKPVRTASFVPVTLRFANSDEVTVAAPVGSGYGPGAGPSPSEEPSTAESNPAEH